jgi:hypothetical protein
MARFHILDQNNPNLYEVVVHSPTPAGNNSVGNPWATCIKNSLSPVSRLPVGNGPGLIASAEANQVSNGTVIETTFQWQDDVTWNDTQRTADLNLRADLAIAEVVANYQSKFKYFGREVN